MSNMLRMRDVLAQTGLSRSTVWRKIRAGKFPPPIELSENAIGWSADVIAEWKANRPRRTYGAPVAEPSRAA
jgi:prophage regulatory protein